MIRSDITITVSESLNIENHAALLDYLRASNRIAPNESPRFETLTGGVSNRTVLVERLTGESWVIKQALAKLRTRADWFSDPSRVHREALGIRWLSKLAPSSTITPLIFEDFAHHLIAMQAVPRPHENWKAMLLAGRTKMSHVEQFGELLAGIHRRAAESDEPLKELFDDRSFFESLRLEPYYQYTAVQVPQAAEFLHQLIEDTRARRLTLAHGDYSPKNILVHNERLMLIDHEVVHWGDPAFDVGFALTHLLSKAHHLLDPALTRAAQEFLLVYKASAGPVFRDANLQTMMVRHTLACLLARVAGRSPLEYLNERQRARQQSVIVSLISDPPDTADELIRLFVMRIGPNAED